MRFKYMRQLLCVLQIAKFNISDLWPTYKTEENVTVHKSIVAAIAIRSLAAQMLCGLALTAKPWRIFSLILAGRHRSHSKLWR